MRSLTTALVAGILVFALAGFAITFAEAYRWNVSPPCKALSSLWACGDRGRQPLVDCMFNRISNWLDFTPEQKDAIRTVLTVEMPNVQALLHEALQNRQELEAITLGGRFVEAEVRGVAQKQGVVVVELIVIKEQVKSEIYPILTLEQRERLKSLQAAFDERIQELIGR